MFNYRLNIAGLALVVSGLATAAASETVDNGVAQVKLRGGTGVMGQIAVGDF